jgi:hypothetical protein
MPGQAVGYALKAKLLGGRQRHVEVPPVAGGHPHRPQDEEAQQVPPRAPRRAHALVEHPRVARAPLPERSQRTQQRRGGQELAAAARRLLAGLQGLPRERRRPFPKLEPRPCHQRGPALERTVPEPLPGAPRLVGQELHRGELGAAQLRELSFAACLLERDDERVPSTLGVAHCHEYERALAF